MSDVLVQFVLDNVWCNPGQDKELTIKPQKVAGPDASFKTVFYLERHIQLPDNNRGYHVYQIGTYYESDDQLPLGHRTWEQEKWYPLSKPLTEENLITYLFTDKGFRFPLFRSYYIYTREKALLLAVERNPLIGSDLNDEDLYVRFYRNAFYDSERAGDDDWSLQHLGVVLTSASQINTINAQIDALLTEGGNAQLFINGVFHINPTPAFAAPGYLVEYIYDPTVRTKERIKLSNCPVYESTLDGEEKHLLIPTDTYAELDTIEYLDDIELYLINRTGEDSRFGLWFPMTSNKAVRMLTHGIYGLQKALMDELNTYVDQNNSTAFAHDPDIEIHFRHSGYKRPLVANTNLSDDLKFLTVAQMREIMVLEEDPYIPLLAATMEAGAYPQVMSSMKEDITQQLCEEALGYNGLIKSFGHALTKVTVNGAIRTVDIPSTFQPACTGYEYNLQGQLMEYHTVVNQTVYTASSNSCNAVELIKGTGTVRPSVRCGQDNVPYLPGYSFRVYRCSRVSGVPQFDWIDITDTNQWTRDTVNNKVKWVSPASNKYLMVRDDSTFVVQDLSPTWSDGVMQFTLKEEINRGVGVEFEYLDMQVPGTDLYVVMNNRPLVRGIDFVVSFPHVFITNYALVRQPVASTYQNLHARTLGLGNGVTEFEPVFDKGHVSHGVIGNNDKYIPKYDKPLRVIVDNSLKIPSTVVYAQDDQDVDAPTNPLNGKIYQVQPYPVPVGDLTDNGEALRKVARTEDAGLIEFMDNYYDPPAHGSQTFNPAPFLVCPFYSRIIRDLVTDTITPSEVNPANDDAAIQAAVAEYMWLLDISPCNVDNGLRTARYQHRPHPYTAVFSVGSADKLNFLQRVLNMYTPGAFVLSTYVSV